MTLDEFLGLNSPEKYDFSNDGANKDYIKLDNNGIKKFFVYVAVANKFKCDEENIMKIGSMYAKNCAEKYKGIPDPDSDSKLLQEIYKYLWEDKNIINFCIEGDTIKGDTMNSQNTTLNLTYKYIESPEQKREREQIKTKNGCQQVSIKYILSRYAEDSSKIEDDFSNIEGLESCIMIYHTLGNFLPVPVGCNGPRGIGALSDYWDLTLKRIHDYYINNIDRINEIVGDIKAVDYRKWLDSFKEENGNNSWKCFVEKNYMQDFVNKDNKNCGYGCPKELWEGHFSGEVLPKNITQFEQYYVNSSCCIIARSIRMISKLKSLYSK